MARNPSTNPKILIGKTIQYASMAFYFTIALWTDNPAAMRGTLRITWGVLMVAGLILILIGKHEERNQKPEADFNGEVSPGLN